MSPDALRILECLQAVAGQRTRRIAEPVLGAAVTAVKGFQHERFCRTYADVLQHPRFGPGARFFLEDLYGPVDFSERDAQFARIVPALVRLFPDEIVQTVLALAKLHALSENLDSDMGEAIAVLAPVGAAPALQPAAYGSAWRRVGRRADREQQVRLTMDVGQALERYTRNPLLRHTLRLMRGPAQAAGLGALQRFLERGFDTFRDMRGARPFLVLVGLREQALIERLFGGEDPDGSGIALGLPLP